MSSCSRADQPVVISDNTPFASLLNDGSYNDLFSQLVDQGGANREDVSFETLRYIALSGYMIWQESGYVNQLAYKESVRALERARLLFTTDFEASSQLVITLARLYIFDQNTSAIENLVHLIPEDSSYHSEARSLSLVASLREHGTSTSLLPLQGAEEGISTELQLAIDILKKHEEGYQYEVAAVAQALGISPNDEVLMYKVVMNTINKKISNRDYTSAIADLKQFEKQMRSSVLRASVLYQIARIYRLTGNLIESGTYSNRAKEIDPESIFFTQTQP